MLFLLGAWRWQLCKVPVCYVLWNCLISQLLKEFFKFTFMVHHHSLSHHLGHRTIATPSNFARQQECRSDCKTKDNVTATVVPWMVEEKYSP